ncbi:O-methyltransferase [Streptomyces sp. NPDC091280]|uniref:O-methyltransferase n=1 Tax=Streptomyces sp. NPDC091280 TaxID=3365984 RepID=UPI0037FB1C9C
MPNSASPSLLHPSPSAAAPSGKAVLETLLRQLVLAVGPLNLLQAGCPEPSTVVALAAGLSDNGRGRLVCCDPESERALAATAAVEAAGYGRHAEVRVGRPEHLLPGVPGPVDLLLLGSAPESYLPLLSLLEPRMLPGAVVVAHGAGRCTQFLEYLRMPGSGYVSLPVSFGGGLEMAVRAR